MNTMPRVDQRIEQRIDREAAALELESRGNVFITVGEALLGMGLILICFVDISIRTGSYLFIWWVIAEGVLGLIFVAIGMHQKSEARRSLRTLEPYSSQEELLDIVRISNHDPRSQD